MSTIWHIPEISDFRALKWSIESFSLEVQNCLESLWTPSDVFRSLRKILDMFVSSSEILVLSG